MVFEDRVLIIFGPRRDEVEGDWRKMYNEELNNLYAWWESHEERDR
jgi:hypothetical protein